MEQKLYAKIENRNSYYWSENAKAYQALLPFLKFNTYTFGDLLISNDCFYFTFFLFMIDLSFKLIVFREGQKASL